jgi:hypothetical protein
MGAAPIWVGSRPCRVHEIGLLYETGTKTPHDTIIFTTLPLHTLIPPTS